MYKHTQTSYLVYAVPLVVIVPLLIVFRLVPGTAHAPWWPTALVVAITVIVCVIFNVLTITVDHAVLSWAFRFGIGRHTVPLSEVARVSVVRNPWYYGWGIHRTPYGWLYNVSGSGAVQVEMQNGEMFRLGSDEPERLARVLTPPGAG